MGGNKEGNVTETGEFNFHYDPEAAYTVLRMTTCPTYIATWELSYKYNFINLSWRKDVLGKINTAAANLLNKLEKVNNNLLGRGSWETPSVPRDIMI